MALVDLVFVLGRARFVVRSNCCLRQLFCEQLFGNGLLDVVFIANALQKPAPMCNERN